MDSEEAARDDGPTPVLVIHGAAVRDRDAFDREVARLAEAIGGNRRFIPVFWGDLARPAERLDDVLPYTAWLDPPESIESDDVDLATAAIADDELDVVLEEVQGADLQRTPRRRRIVSQGDVERLTDRISANWRRQSAAARRRVLGSIYRAVRGQYLAASANFAGDIILYQRRHREIQAQVWQTVMREAPGYGLPERPISVIAHSLGGSVAFDLAVDGHPPLYIDQLLTCACTVPYFHVIGCSPAGIDPHEPGATAPIPPTIASWTNFWLPLDPWGYLAAPVFTLDDGTRPVDIEVHAGEREDRILRHAASNYWRHSTVINAMRSRLDGEPPT